MMPDLSTLLTPGALFGFVALTFLEMVLGVDNIVFVALAADRLPPDRRAKGRQMGMWLAMALRVLLLVVVYAVAQIDIVLYQLPNGPFTVKDLVLSLGGLFLLYKGASEIRSELEGPEEEEADYAHAASADRKSPAFAAVVLEIGLINIVFSIDTAVTAIGMTNNLVVMTAAVMAATLMMMFAAAPVAAFIEKRPTAKVLALAFIMLVGTALVADGAGFHLPRGYLYFAMGFSLAIEFLNGRRGKVGRRRKSRKS
jgi:predicted tellurium resistance membrane protein TerC